MNLLLSKLKCYILVHFRGKKRYLTLPALHDTTGFPVMKSSLSNLFVVVFLIAASWILENWKRNDFMICNRRLVFFLWTSNLLLLMSMKRMFAAKISVLFRSWQILFSRERLFVITSQWISRRLHGYEGILWNYR